MNQPLQQQTSPAIPPSCNDSKLPELTTIIDCALQEGHFSMAYQPIFSLSNSRLLGFEALVRCQSPRFGFMSPADFIPAAEQSGQIIELGEWIYKQTLVDLERLRLNGLTEVCMSMNMSPVQILAGGIFENVMSRSNDLSIPPHCLKIELTETALINDPKAIATTLHAFHQAGVSIWLDDFGTGYASLGLLRKFSIDGIKIDRSFVDGIANNNDDFTLCSAIIAMAQRLGLQIIAEGVEDQEQLQILNQLGCDAVQGYLMGRPATMEANLALWSN